MEVQSYSQNRLLTPEQAAKLLAVSKRTMYEWLRNGEIPSRRIGERLIRVRESDVLAPDARIFFEQACKFAQDPKTIDRAEELFKKAIAINPRYGLAYFELGRMFYTWSHFERAMAPLKTAIDLDPSFPALMNFAMNCNRWGRYEEAENALRSALKLQPNDPTVHYELGICLLMTSFYDKKRSVEAVKHFRRHIEEQIEAGGKQDSIGMAAYFLGNLLVLHLSDFGAALRFAKEIEPTFPNIAEHILMLIRLNARPKVLQSLGMSLSQ